MKKAQDPVVTAEPLTDDPAIVPSSNTALAANSMRTFAARTFATALTIITGIIVAKSLGPSGKGIYSGVLMLVSITMVAPAGIGAAITYALTKQRKPLGELVPALTLMLIGLSVVACAGAAVWAWLHGWNQSLLLFIAAIPGSIIIAWQGGLYVGLGRLRNLNIQSAVLALATLLAVALALLVFHAGATGALLAWLVCLYGSAAVVVWHISRLARSVSFAGIGPALRNLFNFGWQNSFNLLLGTLNYRIDSIILIAMLGAAPFGIYSIAVNFGEALFFITRPVAAAASRDVGVRGLRSSAAMTAKVIRICTAVVAVVAVVAELVGPWTIDAVFGTRFGDAGLPLRILLPGIVVFSTAGMFAAFFILQLGKPMIVAGINVAMIALQSGACYLLVPHWGSAGAAAASTATYVMGAMLNTAWFCRASGLRFGDVWLLRSDDIATIRIAGTEALRSFAGGSRGLRQAEAGAAHPLA